MAVALAALILIAPGEEGAIAQGGILYVDADATGAGDGSSWTVAFFDLQEAVEDLVRGHAATLPEGTDLAALRQARQVLETEPYPLVIFPEGEVYHLNQRTTPFRDGPAAIAQMAATVMQAEASSVLLLDPERRKLEVEDARARLLEAEAGFVDQQREALVEGQVVGLGLRLLLLQRVEHAGELEGVELFAGMLLEHGVSLCAVVQW